MAAAFAPEKVWVGFMDDVPVVGKVKEIVEWILAVYEGNKVVVIDKEKAILKLLHEPVEEHATKLKLTKEPAAAGTSASGLSGLQNVREVELETLHEYVTKAQTKTQKKGEREKFLKDIQENIIRKLAPVRLNLKLVKQLKEELMRPETQRHVLNEDILQFHSKVLKEFVETKELSKHSSYKQEQIMKLGRHTLDSKTETEIRSNMKLDFKDAQLYVNANALLYGKCCEMLHDALINMMESGKSEHGSTEQEKKVKTITDNMIRFNLFVDYMAKNKWIRTKSDFEKFSEVRAKVVRMYKEERGVRWVTEVLKELKPLLQRDSKVATAAADLVWVGFMDIIPVIGTVREGVEWVLAVYEENKEVMKEKEEAILKLLHEPVKKGVMKADGASASGSAERQKVEAVHLAKLPEYLTCGNIGQAKSQKKSDSKAQTMTSKQKEAALNNIKAEVAEKLKRIGADTSLSNKLKIELNRSNRGEHVFNNDVLKFHSDLLLKYVEVKLNITATDIRQDLENLGNHTFIPNIKQEIQTNMVVHFEQTEYYVNNNAVLYGEYCKSLRKAFFNMFDAEMSSADSSEQDEKKERVKHIIDNMNNSEIYVDHFAKERWIQTVVNGLNRFNNVKAEVVTMYRDTRGVEWGINIVQDIIDLMNRVTNRSERL